MTMIERVARAIARGAGQRVIGDGEFYAENYWRGYTRDARAAIEAMREPSPAMLIAADMAKEIEYGPSTIVEPGVAWQIMIDAALKQA